MNTHPTHPLYRHVHRTWKPTSDLSPLRLFLRSFRDRLVLSCSLWWMRHVTLPLRVPYPPRHFANPCDAVPSVAGESLDKSSAFIQGKQGEEQPCPEGESTEGEWPLPPPMSAMAHPCPVGGTDLAEALLAQQILNMQASGTYSRMTTRKLASGQFPTIHEAATAARSTLTADAREMAACPPRQAREPRVPVVRLPGPHEHSRAPRGDRPPFPVVRLVPLTAEEERARIHHLSEADTQALQRIGVGVTPEGEQFLL